MNFRISWCASLLLLAPALAVAQDPVPAPPKQDSVTIRSVSGKFELKGISSVNLFQFAQQCEQKTGYSASIVRLVVPVEIDAGPNDSLEQITAVLRTAVAQGAGVFVEPSSEAGQVAMVYWNGLPRFEGVIESVGVKYTLFMPDGTPSRATVNLRMKQASRLTNKGETEEAGAPTKKEPDCSPKQQ